MKKLYVLLFLVLFATTLSSCNPPSNNLMGDASAENSAFWFFTFNGETVYSRLVFQTTEHRQGIIDMLQDEPAARVTGWTLDDITMPIYGIRMGTNCGTGIWAAWSNGFWITQTGDIYRFDFDFGEFVNTQRWDRLDKINDFTGFPNAVFLTRDDDGWRDTLLTPSVELIPPEGVEMALVSNTYENVTFTLTNNHNARWLYGLHFRVNVLLNDVWYYVPATPGNWGVHDIGLTLGVGQTVTKTHSLMMYGELPPGTYRIVKHDMYVVFQVGEQ